MHWSLLSIATGLVLGATVVSAAEPKPLRVGIIGLDTSHVTVFTSFLNGTKMRPNLPASASSRRFPAAARTSNPVTPASRDSRKH